MKKDKINWSKVGDLRDQHDLTLWLCNRLRVLPQNDASHAIEAIRQEIIREIDGEGQGGSRGPGGAHDIFG